MTERDQITELEHRIGQATMMAESIALEGGVRRECALRFLAALEVPVAEWPAPPDALAEMGGGDTVLVPYAEALRAYLRATGWTEEPPGPGGSWWTRGDSRAAVVHEDDPHALRMALDQVALAEGRSAAEVGLAVVTAWHRSQAAERPRAVTGSAGRESPASASPEPAVAIVAARMGASEEGDRTLRLCPTCLHDGVLERTLERAAAAETQLEHAKAALAGSNEGVRLWMLDCGELTAKHRERARAAEAKLAELENAITWNTSCTSCARVLDSAYEQTCRAEAAEGKLAEIRRQCNRAAELLYRSTGVPFNRQDVMVDARYILEIISTGGDEGDG